MATQLSTNFLLMQRKFLDDRQSFNTIADMVSFRESGLPEGFITYCKETKTFYKFDPNNTVDATYGKWREHTNASEGLSIYDNYSLLPTPTKDTIVYVKNDYVDNTDVDNPITYPKGFYLYDSVNSAWELATQVSATKEIYEEEITTASNTWSIQHNLGEKNLTKVTIYDDEGNEIVLPDITYDTMNLLTVNFDVEVAGKIIIIK